jgi:hypothetical protein
MLIQQLASSLGSEGGLLLLRFCQCGADFCDFGTAARQVLFLFDAGLLAFQITVP